MSAYVSALLNNFRHLAPAALGNPARTNLIPILPTDGDPQLRAQIQWQWIPEGKAGTVATLNIMAGLARAAPADPVFRSFAQQFQGWQELLQWVRNHFLYREEQEEVVRAPRRMLEDMGNLDGTGRQMALEGDCDDVSTFIAAALKVLHYPVRFLAIRSTPGRIDFEHVVAQGFDGRHWVTLDPTVPPGTMMTVHDELIQPV